MCYYDQKLFSCGDWRWHHFRQHCDATYRIGETCGRKFIFETIRVEDECAICQKVSIKIRRRQADQARIARWSKEGQNFPVSLERARMNIEQLSQEILNLEKMRKRIGDDFTKRRWDEDAQDRPQEIPRQHTERDSEAIAHVSLSTTDSKLDMGTAEDGKHCASSSMPDKGITQGGSSDVSSIASSSDQVFSHRKGSSSMTSDAGPGSETKAAQDELFLILTEDHELRSLYQEAFHVMSVDTFEQQFPKLLKTYCADLKREACNDLEKSTVRFMKSPSRRYFITRRICEAFGPQDNRAAKFAKLEKEREERFYLLKRFLKDDHFLSKDIDGPLNDSDDDSESDAGYDYSNVRLLKDFLLGKALSNFEISVRHFVRVEKDKGESDVKASFMTKDEGIGEIQTPPSYRSLSKETLAGNRLSERRETRTNLVGEEIVKVHWQCKCGKRFREDVIEPYPGYANEMLRQCTFDADEHDIEKQQNATELAAVQSSSSIYCASAMPSHRQSAPETNQPTLEVTSDGEKKVEQDKLEQGRWILLCLPGRGYYEVHNTCVKNARCNKEMYAQLHKRYNMNFRRWIRWLTLQRLESVSFIRFHVYWRNNINIEASDLGSLPPPTSTDYDFDRTAARPPILRTALTHFLQHPSHAPKGTRHLSRMPKKTGGMLAIAEEVDEEREGWGLYVREVVCWKKTSLAFGVIGVAAFVFAIVWCWVHDGSLQDGFTVTGVLLAYGTILLGLLQVAVLQQSSKVS